jgi:hypothetical protein
MSGKTRPAFQKLPAFFFGRIIFLIAIYMHRFALSWHVYCLTTSPVALAPAVSS